MSDDSDTTCQRHAIELPKVEQVYKGVRASGNLQERMKLIDAVRN